MVYFLPDKLKDYFFRLRILVILQRNYWWPLLSLQWLFESYTSAYSLKICLKLLITVIFFLQNNKLIYKVVIKYEM